MEGHCSRHTKTPIPRRKKQNHIRHRREKQANINKKIPLDVLAEERPLIINTMGKGKDQTASLLVSVFPFSSQSSDNNSIKGFTKTTKGIRKPRSLPLKEYSGYSHFQKLLQRACPLLKSFVTFQSFQHSYRNSEQWIIVTPAAHSSFDKLTGRSIINTSLWRPTIPNNHPAHLYSETHNKPRWEGQLLKFPWHERFFFFPSVFPSKKVISRTMQLLQ